MSALGQKQTCALHQPMSALPPIATAKADIPQKACLLYPLKRTFCAVFRAVSRALPATGDDVVRQQELQLRTLHSDAPKA